MAVTRLFLVAICMASAALLGGCETGHALRPVPTDQPAEIGADGPVRFQPWSDVVTSYRIGEGDRLRVMFTNTPELDEEVLVRPDGVVTLRVAGEVPVANLTTAEATAAIAQKALARLRHPAVLINVVDPVSARIYIGGEVKTAGSYHLGGPLSVPAALQLASGIADTAETEGVVQIRRGADGRPMLRVVNLRAVLEGKAPEPPMVLPGDILYVPRSRVAEVNLWVSQFIDGVVPFQRSFNYTLGRTDNVVGGGGF